MEEKSNVILLTIDSLRADHLGCLGYSKEVSPYIDDLAKKGVLFSWAISNGSNTPSSFPSIITSSHPLVHPSGKQRGLPPNWLFLSEKRVTIAEVLKKSGYSTAAFNSNPWTSSFFGYNRGFDVFEELDYSSGITDILKDIDILHKHLYHLRRIYTALYEIILRGKSKHAHRASVLNRKAINWLEDHSNGFFIWLHYMDVHAPFIPPEIAFLERINALRLFRKVEKYKPNFSEDELKMFVKFYDGEIKYVDHEIGNFLNEIKKIGVSLDNTYIILTADHGEQLMEHGVVGHGLLYDEVIHVPLIICGPEIEENTVIRNQVELLDICPTILDLLRIQQVEGSQGTSLVSLIKGEKSQKKDIISETISDIGWKILSYRTEEWKYILVLDENDKKIDAELYNLKDDPKEKESLVEKRKEIVDKFETKILTHMLTEKPMLAKKTEKESAIFQFDAKEKDQIKKRLKSLGYI